MKAHMVVVTVYLAATATAALAQAPQGHGQGGHAQPYAGQQIRAVAGLSADDMRGFLDGRGMGLAKSAELNGYPGPMHVLELEKELKLTAEQRQLVKAAFDRMKAKARELGAEYVKAEQAVDQAFKSRRADAQEISARVAEANRLLGEVRLSHLNAHIEITPLLTAEQRALYAELRGYADRKARSKH